MSTLTGADPSLQVDEANETDARPQGIDPQATDGTGDGGRSWLSHPELPGDAKSTYISATLPVGFPLDEEARAGGEGQRAGTILLTELTGEDEDVFASRHMKLPDINAIIFSRRFVGFTDFPDGAVAPTKLAPGDCVHFSAADVEAIWIALRTVSFGPEYRYSQECPVPACKHKEDVAIDLRADLTIRPLNFETQQVKVSDGVIHLRISNTGDNGRSSKMAAMLKVPADDITFYLMAFIDKVVRNDGSVLNLSRAAFNTKEFTKRWAECYTMLKKLPMRQRRLIRDTIEGWGGTIDKRIESECPRCGQKWNTTFEVGEHFFTTLVSARQNL